MQQKEQEEILFICLFISACNTKLCEFELCWEIPGRYLSYRGKTGEETKVDALELANDAVKII